MKKIFCVAVLLVMLTGLAACGQTVTSTGGGSDATAATGTNSTALSMEMQLLVGTIRLDGTAQDVSTEQAAQLLPLWQAILSLESSGTAASEEIDAVVSEIQAAMTADQLKTITDAKLTRADEIAAMGSLGLSTDFSGSSSDSSATPAANPGQDYTTDGGTNTGGPSGSMPSGAAPSGGVPFGNPGDSSTGLSQSQIQSIQSQSQAQGTQTAGSIDQVPTSLVEALIAMLQTKSQS